MEDDTSRVYERANEELFLELERLAKRRRVRMADIHEAEIDALRLAITEAALNAVQAARTMAREHGRSEHEVEAADVVAVQRALVAGARIAGRVLAEDARRQREAHERSTVPSPPPTPRGSFGAVAKAPRSQAWERMHDAKTPTFAEQLDRDAKARERKR